MNDKKLNGLLEAAGDIDDDILENAVKPRRRGRLPMIIAAAAALSLLTGAAAVHFNGMTVGGKQIEYRMEIQSGVNRLSLEELLEMGAADYNGELVLETPPSEVFERYNISPLMNDNFIEVPETYIWHYDSPSYIHFGYSLTDNETGALSWIHLDVPIGEYQVSGTGDTTENSRVEKIELNDGSWAIIEGVPAEDAASGQAFSTASFSYNGMVYDIVSYIDFDGFMGMLGRLGILADTEETTGTAEDTADTAGETNDVSLEAEE